MTDFETKVEVVISQLRADRDRLLDALDKIRAEIEHEADYQDAYVNADIAKGMYLALEIFNKYKEGDNK